MDALNAQLEQAWQAVAPTVRDEARVDPTRHADALAQALVAVHHALQSQATTLDDATLARFDLAARSAVETIAQGPLVAALDPWCTDPDTPYATAALLVALGPAWHAHAHTDPVALDTLSLVCDGSFILKLWRVERCLRAIDDAWRDVPHPGSDEIDSYLYDGPFDPVLYTAHWRDLDADAARRFSSALTFFSPRAFHYFLPMWLRAMLRDPDAADVAVESTLYSLAGVHSDATSWQARRALLTPAQAQAALDTLEIVFGAPLAWRPGAGKLIQARAQLAPPHTRAINR